MATEGRRFRSRLRVHIRGIARATWKQLIGDHAQHPRVGQQTCRGEVDSLIGDLASIVRLAGQLMTNASVALHQADLNLPSWSSLTQTR